MNSRDIPIGDSLILVKPSKLLKKEILMYKEEHFAHGDEQVHGSCGGILSNEFVENGIPKQHYFIDLYIKRQDKI